MEQLKSLYLEDLMKLGILTVNIGHLTSVISRIFLPNFGAYHHFVLYTCIIGNHLRIVSHAASAYHKVLEENRKLYNQIQDLRGKVPLFHSYELKTWGLYNSVVICDKQHQKSFFSSTRKY